LQDLWSHRGEKYYELDDIMLLKIGRHLRPKEHFKMIISREEGETRYLQGYKKQFTWIKTVSHSGPLTLIDGDNITEDDILLAAQIAARFSSGRNADHVVVGVGKKSLEAEEIKVKPFLPDQIKESWYL
jgi:hypothetical protein